MKTGARLAIALGAALTTALHGQVLCPPQTEWQQNYGSTENDSLAVAKPSASGGYFLAGTRTVPRFGQNFYVVRIDADGSVQWEATFGGDLRTR